MSAIHIFHSFGSTTGCVDGRKSMVVCMQDTVEPLVACLLMCEVWVCRLGLTVEVVVGMALMLMVDPVG